MTSNYAAICKENSKRYGTEGAQKSGKLAAGLYDDRTHFIFELLQNAEDALRRRGEWHGSHEVEFTLSPTHLTLSHFGKPFDEDDVRSVCDIAESTKDASSIGRFGLGFKSVYTVTDHPEIHSGDEDFAIENYIYPKAKQLARSSRRDDETRIILPLKQKDANATQDITAGLGKLGPGVLLFLRHIDKIKWGVKGGASGLYRRNSPEKLGRHVQRITVIGKEDVRPEVNQNWLVFHRDVFSPQGQKVGRVECAFSLNGVNKDTGHWAVQPLVKSPMVVFFPTVVESSLGFLVQGPYQTTPSRDNIPPGDSWNQHLVRETSGLLVEAMCWMRDQAMLDVSALRCLPLDRNKFSKDSRFSPMFDAVRQAFQKESLLPTFDGRYVKAHQAKIARTQELRELLSSEQVAVLFGSGVVAWLSGEITENKAPEIRDYLMNVLSIEEITPIKLLQRLSKPFLETQTDEWMLRFYEFLRGQGAALHGSLDKIPLIRLADGTHVMARNNGIANAFLPSAIATSFPTMRRTVCATPEVRNFLNSLGITEPDPVDDVIRNILPKYQQVEVDVDEDAYAADIERIRSAFSTDSTAQKEKLRTALRSTEFVMVVDTGNGQEYVSTPGEVYIATDRLQQLFAGVPDIFMVDNQYACLRGEDIRDLLVSCGASRYLVPQKIQSNLGNAEKTQIRREAGLERASWENEPEDFTLRGLPQLLVFLPTLKSEEGAARVKMLWEALADLESLRGTAAFYGTYKWSYSHETRTARFDAAFIKQLNQFAWVPNSEGELVAPKFVVFDSLGWKLNPFLQSKIAFKPPIIDQLAKEAGLEPALIDQLRKLGITNVADLTARLKPTNPPSQPEPSTAPNTVTNNPSGGGVAYADTTMVTGIGPSDQVHTGTGTWHDSGKGYGGVHGGSGNHWTSGDKDSRKGGGQEKSTSGNARGQAFISYVGTHPDDDGSDSDGLDQTERMQIERCAIDLILGQEATLRRTPEGNPGYDLFEADSSGRQIRWVEVKAMTGTLEDHPVGLSHTQFDYARAKGDAYWLYVVERATDPKNARVLRIRNPVAHARTFTFDHGWIQIAQTEPPTSS